MSSSLHCLLISSSENGRSLEREVTFKVRRPQALFVTILNVMFHKCKNTLKIIAIVYFYFRHDTDISTTNIINMLRKLHKAKQVI